MILSTCRLQGFLCQLANEKDELPTETARRILREKLAETKEDSEEEIIVAKIIPDDEIIEAEVIPDNEKQ